MAGDSEPQHEQEESIDNLFLFSVGDFAEANGTTLPESCYYTLRVCTVRV